MARVASLLPAATETVCALGLAELLVARTHECDEAAAMASRVVTEPKVRLAGDVGELAEEGAAAGGGLSSREVDAASSSAAAPLWEAAWAPRGSAALALVEWGLTVYRVHVQARPNVILTQLQTGHGATTHEQLVQAIAELLGYAPTVLHLDPHDLGTAIALVSELQHRLNRCSEAASSLPPSTVACLQWSDPARGYQNSSPSQASGKDVVAVPGKPSVAMSHETLAKTACDVLVVAICGLGLAPSRNEALELLRKCGQTMKSAGDHVLQVPTPWRRLQKSCLQYYIPVTCAMGTTTSAGNCCNSVHNWQRLLLNCNNVHLNMLLVGVAHGVCFGMP
eukprot:jgi/Chlat1/6019/Chrsp4S06318